MKPIRVFNRTLHRKLWGWLAEHPGAEKCDWPDFKNLPAATQDAWRCHCFCFACVACDKRCERCPLDWGHAKCVSPGTIYNKWFCATHFNNTDNLELIQELAVQIANLPVKEYDDIVTIVI